MTKNFARPLAAGLAVLLCSGTAQAVQLFANGGFEDNTGGQNSAAGWLGAAAGYGISNDAFSGNFSMSLASPQFNAAVGLQNSVEQGGNPPIPLAAIGTTGEFSFYAKGFAGTTGNVLYALRYLDGVGNILANTGNVFFQGSINETTWTQITNNSLVVPMGAVAAFLEFSQAMGPIDPGAGLFAGQVLIDNVSLTVVPVPAAVWLFGSALGLIGFLRRKAVA